jgi:hypothetical protein
MKQVFQTVQKQHFWEILAVHEGESERVCMCGQGGGGIILRGNVDMWLQVKIMSRSMPAKFCRHIKEGMGVSQSYQRGSASGR